MLRHFYEYKALKLLIFINKRIIRQVMVKHLQKECSLFLNNLIFCREFF